MYLPADYPADEGEQIDEDSGAAGFQTDDEPRDFPSFLAHTGFVGEASGEEQYLRLLFLASAERRQIGNVVVFQS